MQEHGLRWHFMREIEERGAEAVIADAIAEALDGPDSIYLSLDIDVIDPGMAPGTGTPEPGGMLTREVLRAIRQIVGAVDLAGMDIVEVSPPYDHAETTAMAANRAALEAISALAVKRRGRRDPVRWEGPRRHRRDRARPATGSDARDGRGPRPALRPRPGRRSGRPRPVPRARRPDRRADPRAGGRHRPARRAARGRRPPGHGGRPRPGDAGPRRAGAPRRPGRRHGPARVRRGRPASASRLPDAGTYRLAFIGLNSLLLLAIARRPAGRRSQTLADHLARAASPSSTSGCPTPTTSPATTGGSSSSGRATDPETGAIVTKPARAQHDAATGDDRPRRRSSRTAPPGEPPVRWIRRDVLRLRRPPTSSRRSPRTPGCRRAAGRRLRPRAARAGQRTGGPDRASKPT